ncbi:hypothetical protein JOB18_022515 [Solea senegalensis]|uniref:Ly6/PLAUR domain-containing protein 1-like n=1 Tax=Solea senegalensis TaxID=28829 RepID=A0AAV6RDL4_SOLSE|nr:hypothetical protein JOB18_022515 [Solea senegalensis]
MCLLVLATFLGVFLLDAGDALQIQCYQCEEMKHNDCSTPEFIVNCTVNVQDMCQKEVLVKPDGVHYRKSCASSGACLIASSGYQQFCTGKLNSVCISCCNTPLCNGPKRKRTLPCSHRIPAVQVGWRRVAPAWTCSHRCDVLIIEYILHADTTLAFVFCLSRRSRTYISNPDDSTAAVNELCRWSVAVVVVVDGDGGRTERGSQFSLLLM